MAAVAQLVRALACDAGCRHAVLRGQPKFIYKNRFMYYVYILKGDNKHYIGYTEDIEKRLDKHRNGNTQTTKIMGELELIGYFCKETKTEAIKLEKMIKRNGHIDHRIKHQTFIRI